MELSEEEKEAKLELNRFIYGKQLSKDDIADYLGILFNLIAKQQKEIENSISKDKIREIIENIEEDIDYLTHDLIEDLEKLLEENNEESNPL